MQEISLEVNVNNINENSFTFEADKDEIMEEVYEYIIGIFDELKRKPNAPSANVLEGIDTEKINTLIEYHYRELIRSNPEYRNMQEILKGDVEGLEKEVEDALDELESTVKENLANCWTGESKDKYVKKLKSQIEDVEDELKDEWKDLSARLTEVADFYKAQDEALAEWEG